MLTSRLAQRRDKDLVLALVLFGCIVALSLGAYGCGKKGEEPAGPGGKPDRVAEKAAVVGTVEVGVLNHTYETNEAAADEKYTGRRMTCLGYVYSVVKTGDGYVVRFVYPNGESAIAARAFFGASQAPHLAKLEKYTPMQFKCLCAGWNPTDFPRAIDLRECEFVPLPK